MRWCDVEWAKRCYVYTYHSASWVELSVYIELLSAENLDYGIECMYIVRNTCLLSCNNMWRRTRTRYQPARTLVDWAHMDLVWFRLNICHSHNSNRNIVSVCVNAVRIIAWWIYKLRKRRYTRTHIHTAYYTFEERINFENTPEQYAHSQFTSTKKKMEFIYL